MWKQLSLCDTWDCVAKALSHTKKSFYTTQIRLSRDSERLFILHFLINKYWKHCTVKLIAASCWASSNSHAEEESSHVSRWKARIKATCLMITSRVCQMRHPSLWATCHLHLLLWPQMPFLSHSYLLTASNQWLWYREAKQNLCCFRTIPPSWSDFRFWTLRVVWPCFFIQR